MTDSLASVRGIATGIVLGTVLWVVLLWGVL